jgi:hypothetical protein
VLAYEIKDDDLEDVCNEVNKLFDDGGKPIKLMIGHTKPGKPQEEQPQIAGYGKRARMGTFGPKKVPAVCTTAFYRKGFENAAAEYPERSPEFKQSTKAITGVALLKTDPRLPMGFMAYEDVRYYGEGFMPDIPEKKEDKPEAKPAEPAQEKPNTSTEMATELAPLEPHERHFADRLMKHYSETHPAMKHLCKQYAEYASAAGAMNGTLPTNKPSPAAPIGAEAGTQKITDQPKKLEDEVQMMDEELTKQYEDRIFRMETENARLYADKQYDEMRRVPIKTSALTKFKERLVKIRTEPGKTHEEREANCKEYIDEVRNNYARDQRAPVGRDFLPIPQPDQTEGPNAKPSHDLDMSDPQVMNDVVRYQESLPKDKRVDCTTDDGLAMAVEAFAEFQRKKQSRQTKTA